MLVEQTLSVEECFTLLDANRKGRIEGTVEIDIFLRKNGKVLNSIELIRIFRELGFDRPG